jgi:hypothetical protein
MHAPTLEAAFVSEGDTWSVKELAASVGEYLADGRHTFAVGNDLKL